MQTMGYILPQLRARPPSNVPESPTLLEGRHAPNGYNHAYYLSPPRAEISIRSYLAPEVQRWTPFTTFSQPENVPAYPTSSDKEDNWPVGRGSHGHRHEHGYGS